jgi:hypothetical protein
MNRTSAFWVLGTCLLACSARKPVPANVPPQAAPAITPEELTGPARHVELGELTLNQNQKPGLVLHADGTVEGPAGTVLGQLGRDGRFVGRDGRLLAELTVDGEILDANGDYLPVVIDGSAVKLLKDNRVIQLREDGTLSGINSNAPVVTIAGVTPRTRRAALFLLVLSAYPVRSGS